MEATSYNCYICKSQKTTGVCQSCLAALPCISNIKRETSDCGCIEEICSCLEASWSLHKPTLHPEFQAEILEDPSLDSEVIVKITPATAHDEVIITDLFVTWLLQVFANIGLPTN